MTRPMIWVATNDARAARTSGSKPSVLTTLRRILETRNSRSSLAVHSLPTAKLLREFLVSQVLRRVLGTLNLPAREREARGALVASQLIGVVMARYVLRLEPLASADHETIVRAIGPTIQRYLTAPELA